MCGIAGFVGDGDRGDLRAMADRLRHRGPDGEGFYVDEERRVHLAHTRLAILDIDGGRQPMWNEDGQVGVIFNGEIYNHQELRRELLSRGHVFESHHSDTEVLVHGYEEWAEELPTRLNGMFAFAVYDKRRSRLFLARDRFGKKPLYYCSRPGFFAFASELKALLTHSEIEPEIDRRSLQKYFAYSYLPAPNSLYRDIVKLPGGHRLLCRLPGAETSGGAYWTFRVEPFETVPSNAESEWSERLLFLLSQAVRRRLMSDVPLGVFLSGGIDSSSILALMTEHVPREQIKTFSIGFHEPSYDESNYARDVADRFGSDHHEQILSLEKARSSLPELLDKLDEPLGDASLLPTHLLSRFTRTQVTVALGGDGGDELFAGYDPFRALRVASLYGRIVPGPVDKAIRFVADRLPISPSNMGLDFKIRRGLRGISLPEPFWNPTWLGALHPDEISRLFGQAVDPEDLYSEAVSAWRSSAAPTLVDRTLEFYTRFYLQDDILTKVDRASMLCSLEARAPFLDYDLVEFARRLPHNFKLRRGATKYILKKALKGVLSPEIRNRGKKGFGIPLVSWLKRWPQEELKGDFPYLDPDWIAQKWSEHRSGKADHRHFLWCMLTLHHHLRDVGTLVGAKRKPSDTAKPLERSCTPAERGRR